MLLQLFGTFAVQVDGQPLPPLRSRRGHWLLALLALQRRRDMDRASLAGLLWPDSTHAQALYNLRRALAELRDVLGSEAPRLSSPHPHTLALDLAGAQVDVVAFEAAVVRGDEASLESAVELYRGPLLEECTEAWIVPERGPREAAYLEALETLAGHAMARLDPAAAIRRLRRAVAVDPFRETAQQALLKALMAGEDTIGALLAYRAFRLMLHQELGAEPSPETKALFHQLRAQARRRPGSGPAASNGGTAGGPGRGAERRAPEARAGFSTPYRLPRPINRFVGRETELHAVEARLEDARLVTLTGPGGVGKTRLAIQVADAIADDHRDGVWFVDLARLSEPALVPQAVASVLAVQEQPGRPLPETLAEFLRSKQLLLVLDNCEHLLSACAELVEALLSGSPELRVLATSRQPLGLAGEVARQVPGLSVPPPASETGGPTPQALMQFEAVRLFVERAMEGTAAFSFTERSARSVGEICRRLDGTPLAIELAAARLKALSAEEIAARLDDRFHLLTAGSRTAPPRHQTLRATMDWSYELLSPPERLLLQRLSVFAGSFSLKAVEGICADLGSGSGTESIQNPKSKIQNAQVLDMLTQLVDQSLVVVERADDRRPTTAASDEPPVFLMGRYHPLREHPPVSCQIGTRYRLLETVRQYARERLRAGAPSTGSGERAAESVGRRHQEFYLRLAEEAAPHLAGLDQPAWLERLDSELDNLRAALDWALEREPEQSLRLTAALARFWEERGYREEGRQRLVAALERAGPGRRSLAGATALAHLGQLAFLRDDYPTARALYEESLAVQRELGGTEAIASALWGLGYVAQRQKEYAEACDLHEKSLAVRRARGDWYGIAQSLIGLGDALCEQGEAPSAGACYYEEALAIRRGLGDRAGVADALAQLANVAWRQGDPAQARRHREESLALWRAIGSRTGVIHSLGALGHLARGQGEYEEARAFYAKSLILRRELGDSFTLLQALEDFAELAALERQWARMTRLLGAAEALREKIDVPLRPPEGTEYDRLLSDARGALGENAVAAAWEAGQAMSLQQAIAFALGHERAGTPFSHPLAEDGAALRE
jgi:predicted ATPase/DNA-binding SARP family transcriptional activator